MFFKIIYHSVCILMRIRLTHPNSPMSDYHFRMETICSFNSFLFHFQLFAVMAISQLFWNARQVASLGGESWLLVCGVFIRDSSRCVQKFLLSLIYLLFIILFLGFLLTKILRYDLITFLSLVEKDLCV